MDLQSTFHIEQVKLVNALNESMNKITNEQSLKWELQEEEGQHVLQRLRKAFWKRQNENWAWEMSYYGWKSETVGIQLQTKSVMWEWASKCSGVHEELPAILVKVLAAEEQAG